MKIEKIVKTYDGSRKVIDNLSFEFEKNKVYSIFGKNGIGKTTLLNIISGHLSIDEGRVFDNDDVMLITEHMIIFEYITGLEFLTLTLEHKKKKIEVEVINEWLEKFEMLDSKDMYIAEYSAGMKYKLMMILIFLIKPKVLLLDEPFAELDILTVKKINKEFQKIKNEVLIIFSTHTSNLAFQMSDEILYLTRKKIYPFKNEFHSNEELENYIEHLMKENEK
ncbi:ABC-2 type transport system ATP-binding protein [Pilibacter termitis]|uniref:ABC-2 type transport system ATP-binding protein n=1 Tax=Pilibacter termitis TaxID=263852 RepID=A0A1T4LBF2_9ENTE|nr:ABC transporter ATP-binding protein [Pilibacter termitis]SJZ51824.1 ABC-2 type transport system ATP-binding protein [Pilibacter termitis]